jgi:hypothetical protein
MGLMADVKIKDNQKPSYRSGCGKILSQGTVLPNEALSLAQPNRTDRLSARLRSCLGERLVGDRAKISKVSHVHEGLDEAMPEHQLLEDLRRQARLAGGGDVYARVALLAHRRDCGCHSRMPESELKRERVETARVLRDVPLQRLHFGDVGCARRRSHRSSRRGSLRVQRPSRASESRSVRPRRECTARSRLPDASGRLERGFRGRMGQRC